VFIALLCILWLCMIPLSHECSEYPPKHAQELFQASLFDKAVPLFQKILNESSAKDSTIRTNLALSYMQLGQHFPLINLLEAASDRSPVEEYCLAVAYRKEGMHEKAVQRVNVFLQRETDFELNLNYELALNLFRAHKEITSQSETARKLPRIDDRKSVHISNIDRLAIVDPRDFGAVSDAEVIPLRALMNGERQKARAIFTQLMQEGSGKLKVLSAFYVIRIDILENQYEMALADLETIAPFLEHDDLLRYEWAYLKGEVYLKKEDFAQAALSFEDALPNQSPQHVAWYGEALRYLAACYLKLGEDTSLPINTQIAFLAKAESLFKLLFAHDPNEATALLLSQCLLIKGYHLRDVESLKAAELLLSSQDLFKSREGQAQALLLRAEAVQDFASRYALAHYLTQEKDQDLFVFAKGWYFRALNEFEEAENQIKAGNKEESIHLLESAYYAFDKAYLMLKDQDPSYAALALKYQALSAFYLSDSDRLSQAKICIETLLDTPAMRSTLNDPDELYYLNTLILCQQIQNGSSPEALSHLESLQASLAKIANGKYKQMSLLLLSKIYFGRGHYEKANEALGLLLDTTDRSAYISEALFWGARTAEQLQNHSKSKALKQTLFENYPESPFAAEAYFTFYSYAEYLQGDRAALKHLESLSKEFPSSPYAIHAWFLIGLDYKRDRKTAEGKWIRKKNLTMAIDAFQKAESLFDSLYMTEAFQQLKTVDEDDFRTLIALRYRASLERVLANLSIAEEAPTAKKLIYLNYAEEGLRDLVGELKNSAHPLRPYLASLRFSSLQEEALYWLAQAYVKGGKDSAAEEILQEILQQYQKSKVTRGYYLSRAWYEQALIENRRQSYRKALDALFLAEDAAKGRILSDDQRLDLWIQQANLLKELGDTDQAILTLSKAINDNAISGLRIKAMLLRAEIYEQQGRLELARRQLESTSKKGGEWAQKAKEKLIKDYGY